MDGAQIKTGVAKRRPKARGKRIPIRTCIACGRKEAKREYIRLVRKPDGTVEVDPTGKANGRGAYLCAQRRCWSNAISSGAIERSLKIAVDSDTKERLWKYARTHFPPDEEIDDS